MKKKLMLLFGICLFAYLTFALPAMAGWVQRQKITSTPRGVGAQFGYSVAMNGNTMVVGARHDATIAANAGSAFVYVRNGTSWTQQAQLLASDGAANDEFGYSVAISENTIIVGAYHADAPLSNSGAAYIFVRTGTTWTQQQKLTANGATASDEFGISVAVAGPNAFVGAHFADLPGNSEAGAVYLYSQNGTVWTQGQTLLPVARPSAPVIFNHFGEAIAVSGNHLVVGAPGTPIPFTSAGAVYVFNASTNYGLETELTISGGGNGDFFGGAVAIEGNTLVGGAIGNTPNVGQPTFGAAYVFEFDGAAWNSQGKLLASDGAQFDRFGWSVAVSNSVIAVGARDDDTPIGMDAGSAYIFTRSGTTWTQEQKLAPTDPLNGDRFGSSVALGFGNLVVGAAEKALTSPNGQGAVYYYTIQQLLVRYDFDGDAKADIAIFRGLNGQWWYQQSSNNNVRALTFGNSTDKPVPSDYDGDGKTDIAVFRPSTGEWFVLRSSNSTYFSIPFGVSTDKPAPGDFDGDGLADICVFRASEGTWYINKSSGGVQITQWGAAGDVPVTNDYDGDGKSDFAIFRPADGSWWLNRSTAGTFITTFGVNTDKPVPADFTGDGKTDIAVWRPSNGNWYILRSEDSSFYAVPFGANGDIPASADYDGDGKADTAIFRPDGANWYIQRSTQGILIQQFGSTGDTPVPASFVP